MTERVEHRLGNYHLSHLVGTGAFADVYLGIHIYLNTRVAIKVLRTQINTSTIDSFRTEARQLSRLKHPNIIHILDFGIENGIPFLVMDYAPGGNLRQRHPEGTAVPLSTVLSYVTTIASSVQYVHDQHLIHRDLKPENLLEGSQNELLLSDFGLALITRSIDTLQVQKRLGNLAYIAPEQIQGKVCPASDQYSLAIMVYEWLSGKRPFEGTVAELTNQHIYASPAPFRQPELPLEIEKIILKALSKDPAQRYVDVLSFAEALNEAYQGVSTFPLPSNLSTVPTIGANEARPVPHGSQSLIRDLPIPLTSLIGRERELELARARLLRSEVRLLTLIGSPGVGKTRLALALAAEMQEVFASVNFVSLASVSTPDLLIPTIMHALGLSDGVNSSAFEQLISYLREKQILLILDNLEQILPAAARLVEILSACPQLKILVTSRAPLHLQGEYEFAVPPLATPGLHHLAITEDMSQVAAVALFVERAEALKPGFKLTKHNAALIAELCVRLGGIPLAIELAAARSKLLSLEALLSRLKQGVEVLTGGKQDAPTRQQTLRNTIRWSYGLLSDNEQALFRRLCIFVGEFNLEAAETVTIAAGKLSISILDGVASLIDKSLLQQYEEEESEPRLYILEIIRTYGLEQLAQLGELEICRQAHAAYYLGLTEQEEEKLRSAEQIVWLKRVELEYENIRIALQWFLEEHKIEAALRLTISMRQFWYLRGRLTEGRRFLEQAIESSNQDDTLNASQLQAKALYAASYLAELQQDPDTAAGHLQASLAIFRRLENKDGIAICLSKLRFIDYMRGQVVQGKAEIEESLALSLEIRDRRNKAEFWHALGIKALYQGQYTEARKQLEESLTLFEAEDDVWGRATELHYLGVVAYAQKDYMHARQFSEESLELLRMMDMPYDTSKVLTILANTLAAFGEITHSRALLNEALELARTRENTEDLVQVLCGITLLELQQGNLAEACACLQEGFTKMRDKWFDPRSKWGLARCLEWMGEIGLARGYATWAVQLCAAAENIRGAHGYYNPLGREQANYERTLIQAHHTLSEKAFEAAWTKGQELSPQKVIAEKATSPLPGDVHKACQTRQQSIVAPTPPGGLTAREVEVLRLLAKGLSNNQIAEQLILSPYTVNSHTQSIYGKLVVNSRSAATRFAVEHNLL